jgi:mersacidin/lichenicidin family type 2 lantibiotic
MSNLVQAWKDETYRQSLSVEEQAVLPANPVGEIELTEVELEALSGVYGGFGQSRRPNFNFFDVDSAEVNQRAQTSFGGQSLNFAASGAATLTFSPTTSQSVADGSCNIGQEGSSNFWDGD